MGELDSPKEKQNENQRKPQFDASWLHQVSQRRVRRLEWPEFASGSQAVVASKEIEDLGKLEDVKILLSGSPFGVFLLAKALSRKRL